MLAIIGGTGLTQMPGVEVLAEHSATTPLGEASSPVIEARLQGQRLLFLARHGHPHQLPPHKINYRANLLALKAAGATQILAINAVGGLDPKQGLASLVLPHQIIDYTWGRESTFYDGDYLPLEHIDFTHPYSVELSERLLAAAQQAGVQLYQGGVYGATQGPRLETAAEIRRMAQDGCTLVGMTGMPEAALAKELAFPYACLAIIVNPAAGLGEEEITLQQMQGALSQGVDQVMTLINALLR
ncbi:5'-methylthioadenosine phosphorylase [Marinospirillum celere]|uniref:Probable 6-oxopurine nucleoside phosphorylase n=1 Tax=Marinospirillum celere TaxID=1122252 RepID=A0A1I1E8A2_9GAMM|nr:S-methyl-5'-thioinosine phosphorylase [Marinospirillum celere]SFB82926.1 5'-methylthioadenosine phosphorylase [Marinospirillum celere]